jgi:4-amino-4-deoxy-L-arabinose transferase-like glycosyltransferase
MSAPLNPRRAAWPIVLGVVLALALLRWAVLALALQDADIGLQVDESQYWNWSQHLQWGYYSKPPGIATLIAGTTALWGDSLIGIKAVGLLVYPVTALVLAALAMAMARATPTAAVGQAGVLAALIFLTSPLAALLGLAATTDAPLLLTWSAATALLWRLTHPHADAPARTEAGLWLLLGAVIGLGLLSKYTFAAWLPGALWVWVQSSRRQRQPLLTGPVLATGVVVALLLPHLFWSAEQGWPTLQHTADITVASQAKAPLSTRLTETLAGPAVMLGLLWLLWLPGLWRRRQARTLREAGSALVQAGSPGGFLVVLHAPLALAGLAQGLASGAQLNWTAPLTLAFTLGLALALARSGDARAASPALVATLVAHLALCTVLPLANPLWQGAQAAGWVERPLPRALDLWGRMRGWGALYAQMHDAAQAHLAAHPDAPVVGTSRTVVAQGTFLWRDLGARWMAPRGSGAPQDHYQLTAGWPAAVPPAQATAPLLIVHEGDGDRLPDAVLAHVTQAELLVQARAPQGSQRTLQMQLWRAQPRPVEPRP